MPLQRSNWNEQALQKLKQKIKTIHLPSISLILFLKNSLSRDSSLQGILLNEEE